MEPPIVLHLAPELRRAAWYWLVGLGLAACISRLALAYGAEHWSNDLAAPSWWVPAVLAAVALLAIFPYRWALRVDEQGLARRRLWGWDFWAWRDIDAGRVRKGAAFVLVDRSRPRLRRSLSLYNMAKGDRDGIAERIDALCRLADPVERIPRVDAALACGGRSATLDAAGLCVALDGGRATYAWSEVLRVQILRGDSAWGDYTALWIVLPDRAMELAPHPESATVAEWIAGRVPPERTSLLSAGQRPARRDDAERLLARHDRENRPARVARSLAPFVIAVCGFTAVAIARGVRGEAMFEMLLFCTLIVGAVVGQAVWERRLTRRQLTAWIAEYGDS